MQPKRKVKVLVVSLGVLAVLGAGFFYLWYVWIPNEMDKEALKPNPEAPVLFGKDDYQIDKKADGTYIIIDKVGLTAKVPDGWTINKEKTPTIGDEYLINLSSPEATSQDGILLGGCGISIMAGISIDSSQEIKNDIQNINDDQSLSDTLDENYILQVLKIGDYNGLQWTSHERPYFGQSIGVDIPLSDGGMISSNATFPPGYKDQCEPIWQDFISNIEIK